MKREYLILLSSLNRSSLGAELAYLSRVIRAFRRRAKRFSQNESFVITRKAVSPFRLGLARASASINVVFDIGPWYAERNCASSIITVPRSALTTKKVSFATNNVLLARPRWHMKDDHNEALYILTWQITIAHVTSRVAESRVHACMRACAWSRAVKREKPRSSFPLWRNHCRVLFEYFLATRSCLHNVAVRYAILRIANRSIKRSLTIWFISQTFDVGHSRFPCRTLFLFATAFHLRRYNRFNSRADLFYFLIRVTLITYVRAEKERSLQLNHSFPFAQRVSRNPALVA
jgi:hypothetical protein